MTGSRQIPYSNRQNKWVTVKRIIVVMMVPIFVLCFIPFTAHAAADPQNQVGATAKSSATASSAATADPAGPAEPTTTANPSAANNPADPTDPASPTPTTIADPAHPATPAEPVDHLCDESSMVDGEPVPCTDDPQEIAAHIEEHWETGTYDENGSDYQLQRIIVRTDGQIEDSRGASDAIYYHDNDEYLLEYDSSKDTKQAYEELAAEYGEDNVMLDTLVTIDELTGPGSSENCICWGSHLMQLDTLKQKSLDEHEKAGGAPAVTVAILDTGINAKHEMFKGRSIHDDSISFVPSTSALNDDHGHGSHVAGIVEDATCRHAEFLIIKVMDSKGQGGMYNIIKGIDYAVDHGAKVINMSVGIDGIDQSSSCYQLMEQSLQRARDMGVVVVASAGNGHGSAGKDITKAKTYPAYSSNTIAVGAIDQQLHHSDFSYYGEKLDFSAPGQSIKSAWKGGSKSYKTTSGTSMAAPEIAAAAAMIEIFHPGYSVDDIYEVLVEHSVDLGAKGKDKYFGYGYVKIPTPESTAIGAVQIEDITIGSDTDDKVAAIRLKSLTRGKGYIRAAWNRNSDVTGYQLRYGTKKTMKGARKVKMKKNNITMLTVTNLPAGTTYYVQIRCYRKDSTGTHYSRWSSIKKVRTK